MPLTQRGTISLKIGLCDLLLFACQRPTYSFLHRVPSRATQQSVTHLSRLCEWPVIITVFPVVEIVIQLFSESIICVSEELRR